MQKQNQFMQKEKHFLAKVLNYKDNLQTIEQQFIKSLLKQSSVKIQEEIIHGDIHLFDPNRIIEEIEKLKVERRKKQNEIEKLDIEKHEEKFKSLKRQIIKLKRQQNELTKKEAKLKSKTVIEKVKKWEEIQQQIKEKKQNQDEAKQRQMNQSLLKQKNEDIKLQHIQRQEKKRQIAENLKKIQEYRLKRQEIIKFADNEYAKLNPKYIEIEKRFIQMEEQINFQKNIYKKNHQLTSKIDHGAIKSHEKNYMTHVKQRQQRRKSLETISQHDFTPYIYRNEEKVVEDLQKLKRRRQFQNKLKELPVPVDDNKRLKIEIARDKGKNPVKYHFLSQKALDEEKIYEEFQDFEVNINPKELGKQYLRELPSITQNSRITKSQSINTLNYRQLSERSKYKDYLQDLKSQRSQRIQASEEEILSLHHSSNLDKSKLLLRLDERARKYDLQLKKRKQELEGYNVFQSSIKKAKQMDQVYVKSIKAKLACLQMKQ